MKKYILTLFCIAGTYAAQAQTTFTGKFAINTNRSIFNQIPNYTLPVALDIKTVKNKLIIARTIGNDNVNTISIDTLEKGGKPFTRITNGVKSVLTLKFTDDRHFIIDRQFYAANGELSAKGIETWSVNNLGEVSLKRDIEQVIDPIIYSVTGVYNKL